MMFVLNKCYNMDCMEAMKEFRDDFFDLAVVDPPYFSGPERRGFYGSKISKIGVHRDYPVSPEWTKPGKEYFDELRRAASQDRQSAFLTTAMNAQTNQIIGTLQQKAPVPAYQVPNPNAIYYGCGTGCGSCA